MTQPHWTQGNLRITHQALQVIEAAARSAYERDEEACGFLTGPAEQPLLADQAFELENLANKYHRANPETHPRTGREYFSINAMKFSRAVEKARADDQPVKVFFHSHLDCGAYFSEEDAASMTMGGTGDPAYSLAYLVTAVDEGVVTAHKLFIWNGGTRTFDETAFEVVGAGD